MVQNDFPKSVAKQLHYTNIRDLSIERHKKGKGYVYLEKGNIITNPQLLERLEHIYIPPAWDKVHVCTKENGHIQAYGYDVKGRKQYIYHPEWEAFREQEKFEKVIDFGEVLPTLRETVNADLEKRGLGRERVLATIIRLLEETLIRIGNEQYVHENNSFGLTTIHNKHVEVSGDEIRFEFKGKSGVYHSVEISDKRVAKVVEKCQELPQQELFEYKDEQGLYRDVASQDVNDYLKAITGKDITAKDFRTWGATTFAGKSLHKKGGFQTKKEAIKNIRETVKDVSKKLRNTTTVCKKYYIHPQVVTTYEKKILIPFFDRIYEKRYSPTHLYIHEFATWSLLKETR